VFSGARSEYEVTTNVEGSFHIADLRSGSPDGADDISNVQRFKFTDVTDASANLVTPNAAPLARTTADIILSDPSTGDYEIYNVGGNALLSVYLLGHAGSPWMFTALGTFQAGDTGDVLFRNASTGAFEADDVSGNNIVGTTLVGTVGTNWNFAGLGNFDRSSLSELMLRDSSSGSFALDQVGGVLSGHSVGAVGYNFQVKGFGFFSENSTTQMLMQDNSGDASNGQLELYTYQPSGAFLAGIDVGKVGSNLTFVGCADLLGDGKTQMVMQQNNGNFWLYTYDAGTNSLSGQLVGAIGSNFHAVGFGQFGAAGQDEMLMQDAVISRSTSTMRASMLSWATRWVQSGRHGWSRGSRPLPRRDRRATQALLSVLPRRSYRQWLRLTPPEPLIAHHSRSPEEPIHLCKPS
jgi:hypothetical protein